MNIRPLRFLPIVLFAGVLAVLLIKLPQVTGLQASLSPMGEVLETPKPLPDIDLPNLITNDPPLSKRNFLLQVSLLNIFASWCESCQAEMALLQQIGDMQGISLYGIAWKDKQEDTVAWLEHNGKPFIKVGMDHDSTAITALGVTGMPETFIVDKKGMIRYHLAGPLTEEIVSTTVIPLIQTLKNED